MSSIPSAAPAAAKPAAAAVAFTAARVHALATKKAASACTSTTSKCKACAGTGKMSITTETFGEPGVNKVSLDCIYCVGGVVNTKKELYTEYIWCTCDAHEQYRVGSLYAADGHRVFGNTTYLCRGCGLVIQFG
jgi:hypothetical protein